MLQKISRVFVVYRRKTLTGSPDPTHAIGTDKPCILSTHLEKCHSILMFESLMNRYLSAHRHTSHLLSLIAINRIEQIYFERIIISTHQHISMKVMTSRSFRIRYLSPYQHISQFRIHEISCIHRSLLAKYFTLYYSYQHIGTDNSVIIPIVDME